MKRLLASGSVEVGKLALDSTDRFKEGLRQFDGCRVLVDVKKETRNLRQNALYFVWVGIISSELGWDREYTHVYNKHEYNLKTTIITDRKTGEMMEVQYAGDTHDMAYDEFSEFMNRVQIGWAEKGIVLSSPEDGY